MVVSNDGLVNRVSALQVWVDNNTLFLFELRSRNFRRFVSHASQCVVSEFSLSIEWSAAMTSDSIVF